MECWSVNQSSNPAGDFLCCQQFALNKTSETTRPRALIFGMKSFLVDLYQVCSDGGSGIQNGVGGRVGLMAAWIFLE